MTWRRAMPVLILGGLFDAIRLFFEGFVVFAPLLGAAFCSYIVTSDNMVTTAIGNGACAVGATAVGVAAAPAVAGFGVIMAMAVGFIGWLTVGTILLKTNSRIFRENLIWFVSSLMISEVPLAGAVPAISLILFKMYRTQIKAEAADRKRWEAEQAAEEKRQAALAQAQAQALEMQAANDALYEEEAANEASYAPELKAA